MLAGITIRGFQSHVDSFIPLGPGLNVITGPSDSGKTAVIRTIRWVNFNEPTGEAYVNKKVGEAEVILHLPDGREIIKRRRKGKTSYQLTDIPEPFEKSEVPLEVTQATGIIKQQFGDFNAALNFAYQLEAPFLISETASAGAKVLGKLAGTEAVDLAIRDVAKDTHTARQDRSQADKDIARVDEQLGAFLDLEDQRQLLAQCEALVAQVEEDVKKHVLLKQLEQRYERSVDQVVMYSDQLSRLQHVPQLVTLTQQLDVHTQRWERFAKMFSDFRRIDTEYTSTHAQLDRLQGVAALAETIETASQAYDRKQQLEGLRTRQAASTETLQRAQDVLTALATIDQAAVAIAQLQQATDHHERLTALHTRYEAQEIIYQKQTNTVKILTGVDQSHQLIQTATEAQERLTYLRNLHRTYISKRTEATQAAENVTTLTDLLETEKTRLRESWGELTICPLCEQPTENH